MRSGSSQIVKTALILGISTVSAALLYQRFQSKNKDEDNNNHSSKDEEEKVNALVEQRFEACSKHMGGKISKFSQGTQLELYGWYKQATKGTLNPSRHKPPPAYDLVAKAKYDAWKKNDGMSKTAAMQLYIDKAMLLEFTSSMQNSDDEDDDEFEDAVMDLAGLGNRPSTLIDDEDGNDSLEFDKFPLHKAAHLGKVEDLLNLLESTEDDGKSNPNSVDTSGQTALHLCADRGHVDCLSALIKAGANLNAGDNDGITSLHAAVISGHMKVCKSLLEAGADPDQADRDGDTPRACADDDKKIKKLFEGYPQQQ
jgi:acyl-CoA-binding protein